MSLSPRTELLPGDHIYVRRRGMLYAHHGIYAGNGKVIHFAGREKEKLNPVVRKTSMRKFLKGGRLLKKAYRERLPHGTTLRLAESLLHRSDYSLLFNNCEHFATYCATGKRRSRQVQRAAAVLCVAALAVVVLIETGARKRAA